MQTSRILRTSVASAVLGLGAVTAVAATAEAAPPSAAVAATAQHGSGARQTQNLPLSDHSTAHVTKLADGTWQAWITHATKKHPAQKHHTKAHPAKKHHADAIGKTRGVRLADGDIAHVTKLPHGTYQAWVTRHGVRVAALDAGHSTARAHGHHYTLDAHTGAVHVH